MEEGKAYVPGLGWLNGVTGKNKPHARPPEEEATWIGKLGKQVYGVQFAPMAASG